MLLRKVNDPANSRCTSARLEDLNWSDWWTDNSQGKLYLHVASKDGETRHRVHCRETEQPRLWMKEDGLYWVVDDHSADGFP